MPSFHVRVFAELSLFIDLPDDTASNILEEHLTLLVNDNAGTGMSTYSAGEHCRQGRNSQSALDKVASHDQTSTSHASRSGLLHLQPRIGSGSIVLNEKH